MHLTDLNFHNGYISLFMSVFMYTCMHVNQYLELFSVFTVLYAITVQFIKLVEFIHCVSK